MSEHTKEPWHTGGKFEAIIYDKDGNAVANAITHHTAHPAEAASWNAARIVACVNACAGVPIHVLEAGNTISASRYANELTAQRDELLTALKFMVANIGQPRSTETKEGFAAAEAAIAKCEVQS